MALSDYHQKYSNKSDEEIAVRASVKKMELKQIFSSVHLKTDSEKLKIAVMGCGDKRFVKYHREYFAEILGKPVELTTFDITIDHLAGEDGIVQHDCTEPLPNPQYDITFAHALLKFITIEKQWDVIINSYNALKPGGLAIHVLDEEDYSGEDLGAGLFSVPLEQWAERLRNNDISFTEIPLKTGPNLNADALALVLQS